MARRWDADNKRWFEDTGRALDQDRLDDAKRQDTTRLGSETRKPIAQTDESDESQMSPLQRSAYRAKKARERSSMTGADAAAALAGRK